MDRYAWSITAQTCPMSGGHTSNKLYIFYMSSAVGGGARTNTPSSSPDPGDNYRDVQGRSKQFWGDPARGHGQFPLIF